VIAAANATVAERAEDCNRIVGTALLRAGHGRAARSPGGRHHHGSPKLRSILGTGALASAFPSSINRALAIPAHDRHRSTEDVEHIVILMQENRSFDHYFGTLADVRGFDDPRAVELPSGAPVWQQPNGAGTVSPFHPDAPNLGLAFLEDLPHGWIDTQAAWNDGKYDRWRHARHNPDLIESNITSWRRAMTGDLTW
jgi:phospholipase C